MSVITVSILAPNKLQYFVVVLFCDLLLIKLGTHARNFHDLHVKGSDAPNIYYLRDYNDAMRVREDIINTYDKIDLNQQKNSKQ